jgi:IS30 family transposase
MLARFRAGVGLGGVMDEFGIALRTAQRIRAESEVIGRRVEHSPHRLSFAEREEIVVGIARGESDARIARRLGRHRSTIGREIARCGGGREFYRPLRAERATRRLAARAKVTKLSGCRRLVVEIERRLAQRWSPEQISANLKVEFPDDPVMRISHETIYLSLYVQSRGELRKQLTRELRSGRTARKPRGRLETRGQIVDMINISQRPAEAADRAVPGHWEGDLMLGAHNRSAVATLVERSTRFVMLAHLGNDHSTDRVIQALKDRIVELPGHLFKTLTWDQGKELAAHARFTVDTGVGVFFCDPHSPWQRGSNENTNGLLRQYMPKGSDLSLHTQADLDRIATELNGRPRETLGWRKPGEALAELITTGPPSTDA